MIIIDSSALILRFSVFNTFLAIGFDGIPFLLPVELTPLQTRAKSVAIATGFFWLCSKFRRLYLVYPHIDMYRFLCCDDFACTH